MTRLDEYADRYADVRMERRDGILQMTLGTDGGPLRWSERAHRELGYAFADVGADHDNKVVILTGTGDVFCEDLDIESFLAAGHGWDTTFWEGKRLLLNLLDVEVPTIAVVNGPARVHADLAVLCDVVLAADHAVIEDAPHLKMGLVPGDGGHVIWPMLLGPNRGRAFLLKCEELSAQEACALGVVSEVLAPADLLPRAWAIAERLARLPAPVLRYTRAAITLQLRRLLHEGLGYGLALEGLGTMPAPPGP